MRVPAEESSLYTSSLITELWRILTGFAAEGLPAAHAQQVWGKGSGCGKRISKGGVAHLLTVLWVLSVWGSQMGQPAVQGREVAKELVSQAGDAIPLELVLPCIRANTLTTCGAP